MAKLARQLHEKTTGGHMENEDWWSLVFDNEANRLFVEHKWSHANVWNARRSNWGSRQIEINDFLAQGDGPAQAELRRVIQGLFEVSDSENR